MQVIGIRRFSYLGYGGFQVAHPDLGTRAAYLYDASRMALRFRFFETVCLPGIRAQTDKDFTLLIVIGEAMPPQYVEHLASLVADIPQVVIEAHPPGQHRSVMHRAIEAQRKRPSEPCLQFRLDDDDGLSIRFVEKLRALSAQVLPLLDSYRMLAIDYNRGYVIAPGSDGIDIAPVQEAYWANALALLKRGSAKQSLLSFGHRKLWQRIPTLTLPDQAMMLRGLHDGNDSRQKARARDFGLSPLPPSQEQVLRTAFAVDAEAVRARFSDPA